jgi:GH24 family phage-related lysozyme (muramidase)
VAIEPRHVEGAFEKAVFEFLAGHDGLARGVYGDGRGIPTLGIGYTMLANTPGWPPRESLESDLAAVGIALTAKDRSLLVAVGEALSRQDPAAATALTAPPGCFSFTLSRAQARALFELTRPDTEALLRRRLGHELADSLCGSREMVALFSLAYSNPALIGPDLVAALHDGSRPRAWYEIRFASNRSRHARLQRRRDREAEIFGLSAASPDPAAKAAMAVWLEDRRPAMKRYFEEIGFDSMAVRSAMTAIYAGAGLPLPPCLRAPGEATEKAALPRASPRSRRRGCEPDPQREFSVPVDC